MRILWYSFFIKKISQGGIYSGVENNHPPANLDYTQNKTKLDNTQTLCQRL